MNSGSILVGQSIPASILPLEADGTTPSGGVVSKPEWSVSDATLAELTSNADGTASIKGLAAGSITVAVTATVTDTDGAVSTLQTTATLVINAPVPPPPAPTTASISIVFGEAK